MAQRPRTTIIRPQGRKNVLIPKEELALLEGEAARRDRTLPFIIREAITYYCVKRGLKLPSNPKGKSKDG